MKGLFEILDENQRTLAKGEHGTWRTEARDLVNDLYRMMEEDLKNHLLGEEPDDDGFFFKKSNDVPLIRFRRSEP